MGRRSWALAILFGTSGWYSACVGDAVPGAVNSFDASIPGNEASSNDDSAANPSDSAVPACNLNEPFGAPSLVSGLSALGSVARFSPDEKTAYFAQIVSDSSPVTHLFKATRQRLWTHSIRPLRFRV